MSGHTPGPWVLMPERPDGITEVLVEARVVGADMISPAIVFGGIREAKANARLIAAAPELLEAAQEAVLAIQNGMDPLPILFAALAKAEGRS